MDACVFRNEHINFMFHLKLLQLNIFLFFTTVLATAVHAKPFEVITEVDAITHRGSPAIHIHFSLPVHYVSHAPAKHGKVLTIKLMIHSKDTPAKVKLPRSQSFRVPKATDIPLRSITYVYENNEPMLYLQFNKDIAYTVSQSKGSKSLMIAFPGTNQQSTTPKKKPQLIAPIEPADETRFSTQSSDTPTDKKALDMLNKGKDALRNSDPKKAIGIFTAILSLPQHKYMPESLEFLGIARERNNQLAQAKTIYNEYLLKYPQGQSAIRVRQRLADMINNQLAPKQKLKKSEHQAQEHALDHSFFASFSQILDVGAGKVEGESASTDTTYLDSQLYLQYRLRGVSFDIRNVVDVNYGYEYVDDETDGIEVNKLSSKFKQVDWGLHGQIGRQSPITSGVFGKFDGVWLGYDIVPDVRLNVVQGYPVDFTDKKNIQTDNPFTNISLEFNDFWKSWEIGLYHAQQDVEGVAERRALGVELRYFAAAGNFTAQADYDTLYEELNLLTLRSQYNMSKNTFIHASYDKRNSPLLLTSNALLQIINATMTDLRQAYTEEEIRIVAKDRTGESVSKTIGLSHAFSQNLELSLDLSRFEFTSVFIIPPQNDDSFNAIFESQSEKDTDSQDYYTFSLIAGDLYAKGDSVITRLVTVSRDQSDGYTLSSDYRFPLSERWLLHGRLAYSQFEYTRSGGTQYQTKSFAPSMKADYQYSKTMRIYSYARLTNTLISGDSLTPNSTDLYMYLGYDLDF